MNAMKYSQNDIPDSAKFRGVAITFLKMSYALFGLYIYEWFLSLDFEWEFVTGKRQFRWPMIFYFANRYCALAAVIGIIIAMDMERKFDCTAWYIFIQLTAAAAVGLSSINLSIRTIAIWSSNKYVVGGLTLAIIGQWSLVFLPGHFIYERKLAFSRRAYFLFLVGQLRAKWSNIDDIHCLSEEDTTRTILSAFFIYAMFFDLIVLLLTSYKIFVVNSSKMSGRSRFAQMIFVDGLCFFMVAFLVNLMATIFITLDLNMTIMLNGPAAVLCTIAACRTVRRLKNSVQNVNADRAPPKAPLLPVHIQTEIIYHRDE